MGWEYREVVYKKERERERPLFGLHRTYNLVLVQREVNSVGE